MRDLSEALMRSGPEVLRHGRLMNRVDPNCPRADFFDFLNPGRNRLRIAVRRHALDEARVEGGVWQCGYGSDPLAFRVRRVRAIHSVRRSVELHEYLVEVFQSTPHHLSSGLRCVGQNPHR
jgi:hypothetical protein